MQAGLTPAQVLGMSVLVFAGASQFVTVPMIAAGAPALAVVVTTYVVNGRPRGQRPRALVLPVEEAG